MTGRARRGAWAALFPQRASAHGVSRATSGLAVAIAAAAIVAAAGTASAQDVRISGGDCGQPVHLVARDAPLSSVLQRLADALRFKLTYQSERDPLVRVDARLAAPDLVRKVAGDVNFSMEQAIDRRCATTRVAKLSILPDRLDGSRAQAAAKPAWQTPEFERIARQGLSDYLQSHGMEDKPLEEIAVH